MTFELYGSNQEGRRPAAWRLPATPVEGFDPKDNADADRLNAAASAAAGRRSLAAAAAGNLGCLEMFNPDTQTVYRDVVAGCAPPAPCGRFTRAARALSILTCHACVCFFALFFARRWVHNFLLLAEHMVAHRPGNATSAPTVVVAQAAVVSGGGAAAAKAGGAKADAFPRKALRPRGGSDDAAADGVAVPACFACRAGAAAAAVVRPLAAAAALVALAFALRAAGRGGAQLPWPLRGRAAAGAAARLRDL
jgi:hypothetical protein